MVTLKILSTEPSNFIYWNVMKNYFMLITKLLLVLCILMVGTLAQSLEYSEPTTLGYAARNKLKKVYQAVGLAQDVQEATKVLDLLSESWSRYDTETRWANNLTGDLCPLEFSLTFKGNEKLPIVRFLIEPQESPFTIQSSWKVGLELKEKLKVLPGVDVSKFDKIYPIFSPLANPQTPSTYESFSIWYAADLGHNHPQFKVYLNPRILGEKKAPEFVQKALTILNSKVAWNFLFPRLSNSESKLAFLSLDLSTGVEARIKVYVADQLINTIEKQLQGCRYYVNDTASSWIKTLINKEDFFNVKPIVITFNFTTGNDLPVPTVHIPVHAYVKNDKIVIQRLNKLLSPNQIKLLTTIISQISERPLES